MKQLNTGMKTLLGLIGGLAIWAMVMFGGGSMPASVAYAATPEPQKDYIRLEYALKAEQLRLKGQQNHLDQAREGAALAQSFIDELKARDEDTSQIEAALNSFNTQIEASQTAHDTAKQILDAKAGFDVNGKVTDPGQARETLQSGRQALEEAGRILQQAVKEFHQAMREFRQANRPTK